MSALRKIINGPKTVDLQNKKHAHYVVSQLVFWDNENTFEDIAVQAGVCVKTVSNLAYGKTKSAHMSTIAGIASVYGYKSTLWR